MGESIATTDSIASHRNRTEKAPLPLRMVVDRVRAFTTTYHAPSSSQNDWLQLDTWFLRDDWVVNLAEAIGSPRWWRGIFSLTTLITAAALTYPVPKAVLIPADTEPVTPTITAQPRKTPLSAGLAMNTFFPEKNHITVVTTAESLSAVHPVGMHNLERKGLNFVQMLEKSGVATEEAQHIRQLIETVTPVDSLAPETIFHVIMSTAANPMQARKIEHLNFQARFDAIINIDREKEDLKLTQHKVPFTTRPIRFSVIVDKNIPEAVQAVGLPRLLAENIEKLLKKNITHPNIFLRHKTRLDMVLTQRQTVLGEKAIGDPLYIALKQENFFPKTKDQQPSQIQLFKWEKEGESYWLDEKGRAPLANPHNFIVPVSGRITSPFGYRYHPILGITRFHKGIDISGPYGTPIKAAADGQVIYAGQRSGYGNFILIDHGRGIETAYGHMSRLFAHQGQYISQGQMIGQIGSSGLSTGPHLHYEVHYNNTPINPNNFVSASYYQLAGQDLDKFRHAITPLLANK
ncbi:MAG: M23 family metallopeptidase [Zymomonas mobilis subsp. pomaceae]|uniref:Peptidase M23 n=1 Tax=Zymomonas mobilis subsp. pomaceae (strain ATCC 29192 / DSM 22645 / JCM 10191 / CCUG 17912 / NBRC 13757 / NCIMB 11200 / NRRL B-4491 / Barker I) TaxID=579138 RepID=F8ESS3_ZYMMT|nr:M23 family metallopeptidase [Zymomonas mobilis]AEI37848.1 Peptidase M23 [Zymomonas mobilis subsp. pomaceae ATCC 29192]MDX5949215.1 M23 family metallopeptidase [Zymomonas mobilis subsp. pomaceae]GEB89556.1 hypothetical protein ZMO02_11930 [Zymomonas mobilis subsp. pomaceae]